VVSQILLTQWVELKRWNDFKNPGSQGDGSFLGVTGPLKGTENGYPGGAWFDPMGFARGDPAKYRVGCCCCCCRAAGLALAAACRTEPQPPTPNPPAPHLVPKPPPQPPACPPPAEVQGGRDQERPPGDGRLPRLCRPARCLPWQGATFSWGGGPACL
jgi:hypothetical protein